MDLNSYFINGIKRFDTYVLNIDFQRSSFNIYLYFKGDNNKNLIYLLLYVDDILLAGSNIMKIQEIKNILKLEFDTKDLG